MPHTFLNRIAARSQQIRQQLEQDRIQHVALWLDDALDFACALFACFNAKATVLLPPNILAENQQWITENADLLLDSNTFSDYGISQKIDKIHPLVDRQSQSELCLKTSGSSGKAKIIRKTAQQMWAEAQALARTLPFEKGEDTLLLGSVSVQHLYGLTFRIFLAAEMNWEIGRTQLQYPEYLIAASRRAPKAIWVSSPALLTHLNLENPELAKANIVGVISSGGSLPETVASQIRTQLAKPLVEIYGSTETGIIAHRLNCGLWQPFPNSEIGCNAQGALWVNSPWLAEREQTADAVELTSGGFRLLGRIDRIVKLGDKRVSLAKIEQDLFTHPAVKDCYLALHPTQQRPVAWLALTAEGRKIYQTQGRKTLIAQLRQHLADTHEKFALPRFWRFSAKLPRNSQAKISRADFERICQTNEDEINECLNLTP